MKPERDKKYLDFVRSLDCARCDAPHCSEASHSGPRGLGQKTSDYLVAPLCHSCHAEFDGRAGVSHWGLGKEAAKEMHMLLNIETMLKWLAINSSKYFDLARKVVRNGNDQYADIANALKGLIVAAKGETR